MSRAPILSSNEAGVSAGTRNFSNEMESEDSDVVVNSTGNVTKKGDQHIAANSGE